MAISLSAIRDRGCMNDTSAKDKGIKIVEVSMDSTSTFLLHFHNPKKSQGAKDTGIQDGVCLNAVRLTLWDCGCPRTWIKIVVQCASL